MVASASHSAGTPPPASVALLDLRPTRREGDEHTAVAPAQGGLRPPRAAVATLPDPCTDESRQYLSLTNDDNMIYELNALSTGKKYSSYLVGSRVVSTGAVSVGTAVDPLFFVLACVGRKLRSSQEQAQQGEQHKWKWQPLEQALDDLSVPPAVRRALRGGTKSSGGSGSRNGSEEEDDDDSYPQLRNLFTVTDQFGDDLLLYKFNEAKALSWLETKHARTLTAVQKAALTAKRREEEAAEFRDAKCGGNGAFSAGFVADDGDFREEKKEEQTAAGADSDAMRLTEGEETAARGAALQFVCGYLGEFWRTELIRTLDDMNSDALMSEKETRRRDQRRRRKELDESEEAAAANKSKDQKKTPEAGKKRKLDGQASTGGAAPASSESDRLLQYAMGADGAGGGGAEAIKAKEEEAKKTRLGGAKSVGLKKLAKVNTKGMKSLASFFGGGGGGGAKKKKKVKKQ